MRGEAAPEGWGKQPPFRVWSKTVEHVVLTVRIRRTRDEGHEWAVFRHGMVLARGYADRLTGPGGAFEMCEAAAEVRGPGAFDPARCQACGHTGIVDDYYTPDGLCCPECGEPWYGGEAAVEVQDG